MIPLDPRPDDMRAMGEAALGFAIDFLQGLDDTGLTDVDVGMAVARELRGAPPDEGRPFEEALAAFVRASTGRAVAETCGPGYLPYVPGGGLYTASLAQFLAMTVNRFPNLWEPAPGLTQIEENVVRWMCDLFAFPPQARGILTSGGSIANLSAIVAARHARLGEEFVGGTYYVSTQAHASVTKAASIAGLPRGALRLVPVDRELRMDTPALERMIGEDRDHGLRPFLVVPAAGTTNTGAIDPLMDVAEIAHRHGLWMHVDAAYGGFFQLTERGRERFRGIERADSITLDPHKGMFLPYGTGSLIVREGGALHDAMFVGAEYLQDRMPETELPNLHEYSPELSRDHRGFRVWLPLWVHGVRAFREALDEKLDLAERLATRLSAIDGIEVSWTPQLTVVPFRLTGADAATQRALLDRINASRRVVLSSTTIDGDVVLRACIVSHRTHADRIDECADIVREAATQLVAS